MLKGGSEGAVSPGIQSLGEQTGARAVGFQGGSLTFLAS